MFTYKKDNFKVPIRVYISEEKYYADIKLVEETEHLAQLPFVFHHVGLSADGHPTNHGMPIGGILATEKVVIPNCVGVDIGCFTGDTKIPLVNGLQKTIKELAETKEKVFIYSVDKNRKIVIGKAIANLTRRNAKLIEIIISGGESIKCTPDHKFMLLDGTYKEAQLLTKKDSLMPLYRSYDVGCGYEHVKSIRGSSFLTHKIVAKQFLGKKLKGFIIHHKDGNTTNNYPNNLEYIYYKEHSRMHALKNKYFSQKSFQKKRLKTLQEKGFFHPRFLKKKILTAKKNLKEYLKSEQFKINVKKNGKRGKKYLIKYNKSEKGRNKSKEISNRLYECEICKQKIKSPIGLYNHKRKKHFNHKVLFIKNLDYKEDVYCLTVEKYHNFALSAGVFVHNCGMNSIKTPWKVDEISTETLKKIMGKIREAIPVGFNHHRTKQDESLVPEINDIVDSNEDAIILKEYENALTQIGTLGGGNHFIEIQKDNDNNIWIMIHSGSRNLGLQVANYYNHLAENLNNKWYAYVPKEWKLAFLPIDSEEGKNYLAEMNYCVEFALANRKLMMERIAEIFNNIMNYKKIDLSQMINIAHNYARLENHFGHNVIVHRKGATSARKDEIGIVPGSQGTKSYIVRGLGNKDSFESCSHGAGRIMGRKEAERTLNLEEQIKKMNDLGIIHGMRNQKDLDEAPDAYKSIDEVMSNQKDLVEIITELKPIAVIKGD